MGTKFERPLRNPSEGKTTAKTQTHCQVQCEYCGPTDVGEPMALEYSSQFFLYKPYHCSGRRVWLSQYHGWHFNFKYPLAYLGYLMFVYRTFHH